MKIHIIKQGETAIEGYKKIELLPGFMLLGLDEVSDNEAEVIFANDILDALPANLVQQTIAQLVSKLRLGGILTLGGTELRTFTKNVTSQTIPEDQAIEVIRNSQSMVNINSLSDLIRSMGLEVEATTISGIHCEVKCVRN
jgi:SAM-dependent MidA family methyltransferase